MENWIEKHEISQNFSILILISNTQIANVYSSYEDSRRV